MLRLLDVTMCMQKVYAALIMTAWSYSSIVS